MVSFNPQREKVRSAMSRKSGSLVTETSFHIKKDLPKIDEHVAEAEV